MIGKTAIIASAIVLALLVAGVVGWRLAAPEKAPVVSSPRGCNDNSTEVIDGLGGSERAAMNGISSTLERCIE